MGKKITSSRPKGAGAYNNKSYSKPAWMKILRTVFLAILYVFMTLAIFGLAKHLISHFK